jgi:hypothetical protein
MPITIAAHAQSLCYKMKRRYSFACISMKMSRNASRPRCACVVSMRQYTVFLLSVRSFFTLQGEKRTYRNEKYHAAVHPEPVEGQAKAAFCVSPNVQIVLGASSLPQRHPAQRLHLNRDRFVRLGLPLLRVGPDDPLVEQRV